MAASIAGLVRGFAGFGGPATVSLLLTHFFSPATLLPKIALLDFYAYPLLIWNVRRDAHWRLSLPMAAVTVCIFPIGLHSMQVLDASILKRLIGLAAILAVGAALSGFRFKKEPPIEVSLVVATVLGWVLGATFIALPVMTYLLMMPYSAAVCRATVISYSLAIMPCLVTLMFHLGLAEFSDVLPVAAAGVTYFVMVGIGAKVFAKSSERNYRRYAQWLLLILATAIVF